MSRFFSTKYKDLEAYVPGEQPRDRKYIKLNTNESPYPPAPLVSQRVEEESHLLHLYSDPECRTLTEAVAARYGLEYENILMTNGSDEVLNFAFMAFCDASHPAAFPDITYGFYPVFARLNSVPFREIPLKEDWSVDLEAFRPEETVFLANPNAPTGRYLPPEQIEALLASHRDRVVVVDEAYIDFGGESCLGLLAEYDNLLITRTFSKSRSLAGARLGFCMGNRALIRDLNTIKYSTNPYNVNRMTMAAGLAALEEDSYYMENCCRIVRTREKTATRLKELGFCLTESQTNFLFTSFPGLRGEEYSGKLRKRGVLVRHFGLPRIREFVRVTVGTPEQMERFLSATEEILRETKGTLL